MSHTISFTQNIPEIRSIIAADNAPPSVCSLVEEVKHKLYAMLPDDIFASYEQGEVDAIFEARLQHLDSYLPYMHWEISRGNPGTLYVCVVGRRNIRFAPNEFIKELLSNWLVPAKSLHIIAQKQLDFVFASSRQKQFYFIEFFIELEKEQEAIYVQQSMPGLLQELRKGLLSSHDAFNILQTKGVATEEKDVLIVNEIRSALERKPLEYDKELLNEIRQFLFQISSEFKQIREVAHLARVVCSHYMFRRTMQRLVNKNPRKRHVCLKLLRTKLHYPFGQKPVQAIIVGVNALNVGRELLEQQHLLEAVQNIIPGCVPIKASFQSFRFNNDTIRTVYFEVAREDGVFFTNEDVKRLRIFLPNEIKLHIEHLVPMTFMRRNEEEVYRNILLLREQTKYVRDIPQVIISFEEQTMKDLFFTVVLVRVLYGENVKTLEELFQESNPGCVFIPDRREIVGYIRKKYPKEANVFRLQLPKTRFLRKDRSVDLYKARHYVGLLLKNALGKIRDYNGGLILKQDERLKDFVGHLPNEDRFLLENFFYSITPIVMQGIIPSDIVKSFYTLFKKVLSQDIGLNETFLVEKTQTKQFASVIFRADDMTLKEEISDEFSSFQSNSLEWASVSLNIHGTFCFGYIVLTNSEQMQSELLQRLYKRADLWLQRIYNRQVLRVNLACKTPTLDPRVTRTDNSAIIVKMLYEGLTRMGQNKKPHAAIARDIEVSDDGMRYTFHLRDSRWTDKSAITAYDFEYSWKKSIENSPSSMYRYTFQVIKNADAIMKNQKNIEELGVYAVDDKTLVVDLEYPTSHFLELTSHWTYLLINSKVDRTHPGWAYHDGMTYVCNGPFKLKNWQYNREIVVEKNPEYWDADSVKLEEIVVSMVDNPFTELRMYENDEIDLTGIVSASLPLSRINREKLGDEIKSQAIAGVYSLWLNVQKKPFNNRAFRNALSLAIDREDMQKHLIFEEQATQTVLPQSLTQLEEAPSNAQNVSQAKAFLQQALYELDMSVDDLPVLHLNFSTKRRRVVCELVKKYWEETLGVRVHIEEYDWSTMYNAAMNNRHDIIAFAYCSWFWDPTYIFSLFTSNKIEHNPTNWQHPHFDDIVRQSNAQLDPVKRKKLLQEAEQLLIDESPTIPLHQCSTFYLQKSHVQGVYSSELLETDFKWAHISRDKPTTSMQ